MCDEGEDWYETRRDETSAGWYTYCSTVFTFLLHLSNPSLFICACLLICLILSFTFAHPFSWGCCVRVNFVMSVSWLCVSGTQAINPFSLFFLFRPFDDRFSYGSGTLRFLSARFRLYSIAQLCYCHYTNCFVWLLFWNGVVFGDKTKQICTSGKSCANFQACSCTSCSRNQHRLLNGWSKDAALITRRRLKKRLLEVVHLGAIWTDHACFAHIVFKPIVGFMRHF